MLNTYLERSYINLNYKYSCHHSGNLGCSLLTPPRFDKERKMSSKQCTLKSVNDITDYMNLNLNNNVKDIFLFLV